MKNLPKLENGFPPFLESFLSFILNLDMLIDGQLICHQEAMRFLVESGGRALWTPEKRRK